MPRFVVAGPAENGARSPGEAAAHLRASRHEIVYLGINDLQRQRRRQHAGPPVAAPVDTDFETVTTVANPQPAQPPIALGLAKQHELGFTVPDQVACRRASKRFAPPQIRQRLQETRLPGGVFAIDQVEPAIERQVGACKAAKIGRLEPSDHCLERLLFALQPHRHDDERTIVLARLPYQATRIAVLNR